MDAVLLLSVAVHNTPIHSLRLRLKNYDPRNVARLGYGRSITDTLREFRTDPDVWRIPPCTRYQSADKTAASRAQQDVERAVSSIETVEAALYLIYKICKTRCT